MKVFLDIETIPSQNPAVKEQIAANMDEVPPLAIPTCPKTYKKPETIQAWHEETLPQLMLEAQQKHQLAIEKREAAIEEKWRKTALSGEHGQIVCIGWAVEDEEPRALLYAAPDCERQLLREFFMTLSQQLDKGTPTWIGHNINFDLRFLFQRAVILDVCPELNLHQDASPYGGLVFDTMQMWAGWQQKISLDRLCLALGLPGKAAAMTSDEDHASEQNDLQQQITNGSQVWDYIQQNKLDDVINYCKADVKRCRAVYRRLTFYNHYKMLTWIANHKPQNQSNSAPLNPLNTESSQANTSTAN